jgi:hypothetical protein
MTQIWNLTLTVAISVASVVLIGVIAKAYWLLFTFGWGLL